jgi:hypothetical protein
MAPKHTNTHKSQMAPRRNPFAVRSLEKKLEA